MSNGKKVILLGGGVAGMSAAHGLIHRGFEVELFELKAIPGGKARSMPVPGSHTGALKELPGEHGFRFFPGFYQHITETMRGIPFIDDVSSVYDNLVDATQVAFASYDRPLITLPAKFPATSNDLLQALIMFLMEFVSQGVVIPVRDFIFFTKRVWQILTSCDERRSVEYENISWWDYTEAASRSPEYRKFFVDSLTRTLVASRSNLASTRTVGNTFIQLLLTTIQPGVATDRILNGPTNDAWIDRWLDHLTRMGVRYNKLCRAVKINCEGAATGQGRVRSVIISNNDSEFEVTGDYYIACLPVEAMAKLVDDEMLLIDPALANINLLAQHVEWMNGIQFYLNTEVPVTYGHVAYVDSEWNLTSVSQHQFWPNVDLSQFGDGQVREILSVVISDWDEPGLNGKKAKECRTEEEIKEEVWAQLKRSLNTSGSDILKDQYLVTWFLDPDIEHSPDSTSWRNEEPLFVNDINTWQLRPDAATRIPNLFLAADYVRTHTDIACMEAANEAARHAVNHIIDAAGVGAPHCQIWPLSEPSYLQPLKDLDRKRWERGEPWQHPIRFPVEIIQLLYLRSIVD